MILTGQLWPNRIGIINKVFGVVAGGNRIDLQPTFLQQPHLGPLFNNYRIALGAYCQGSAGW